MRVLILFVILLTALLIAPTVSGAQPGSSYQGTPYGHFCPGMQWGPYGVRKPVKTAAEAKQVIETYFSGSGQVIRPGKVEEKRLYFEVEILDRDGVMIDKAVVDKRTGRIRSIY